jgi:tetratricopeptide (TPR) repeat protein
VKYLALFAICLVTASTLSAQAKKPVRRSKGEVTAINALLMAQTPDDRIKAAEDLITKFADTDFKPFALFQEANAYELKNSHDKAIVYAEQAIAADPKNYDAMILIANITASQTKDTDLDMAEKLSHAEKMANDGMEILKTAQKPTIVTMTEAQWTDAKNSAESSAWQALGTIATVRKKPDEAVADFEKGLALSPDPVLMLRTGRALLLAKKYDEAITWFDKANASPDASAQIKSIATSDKARATALKGQAK